MANNELSDLHESANSFRNSAPPLEKVFQVNVPIPGELQWHELCRCESAEKLAEVVRILMGSTVKQPSKLMIETIYG